MTEVKKNIIVRYVQEKDRDDWVRLWKKFIATYEDPKLPDGIEKANFEIATW